MRHIFLHICLVIGLVVTGPISRAEEPAYDFLTDIAPLVDRYCVDCHNPDDLKGDLDLLRFETDDQILDALAVWQRAGKRIESREMPPRKSDYNPTDEERATLLTWINSLKFDVGDCDRLATEESVAWYRGYVMSRRLNRSEYENTLRDLLGVDLEVREMFPADGAGGEGFDNNGDALFLSAIQVEKYLDAAELAMESALPRNTLGPAAPRRRLIAMPEEDVEPRAAAVDALDRFLERAWRRPAMPGDIDRLMEVFDRVYERGDGYEAALKMAYTAALVSPNFVFLAEPEPEHPGVYALGDYPLAAKLSYFLWASMPDEELFALAREGKLQSDEVLRAQVQRMLRDPKARALGDQFASQWLNITQLGGTTKPDAERFPEFDEALNRAMHEEVSMYFTHLIAENRSLLELIDSNYTFANESLAEIYGIEGVLGDELRRVEVNDPNRGGVLGMGAVLTATSHPLRTSPVLRGKWVLEQLLGDRVPPPPPDAGTLPEDDKHPEGLTFREQLELHREQAECASCHARMDPIGFGLENFDPIGRWRETQGGQPVDSEGVLPSGETFNGPRELKDVLLKQKDQFARNLTRKMLGYALGRSLSPYDECVIDRALEAMRADEYRPSHLFTEIVLSYPFRHRYSGGAVGGGD